MNDFKILYKILRYINDSKGKDHADFTLVGHEALGISLQEWSFYIALLVDNGYIENIGITRDLDGQRVPFIHKPFRPSITLKGMEYLETNGMMAKAKSLLSGVLDIGSKFI